MTLLDAKQYDEVRARRRRIWILTVLTSLIVLLWLAWTYRNWPEERSVEHLFAALEQMMEQVANHQLYYEVAYEAIIQAGEPFKALDITGLRWVEIDTLSDYRLAQEYFSHPVS